MKRRKTIAGKVAGACKKRPKSCAAGVIGIAAGTALAIDHANKSKLEQQCITWCTPKKWNDIREQVKNDQPPPDSLPDCTNEEPDEGPCYRTWDTLMTDPEFAAADIPGLVENGDLEDQPFCTSVEYDEVKPAKGNKGGNCELFCVEECQKLHRSLGSKLFGGLGGLGKILGNALDGILSCLEDGGACLMEGLAIFIGVIVVIMILIVIVPVILSSIRKKNVQ